MSIVGVASALPEHVYLQEHIIDALIEHWGAELKAPERLLRIHSRAGVDVRHLAFSLRDYAQLETWRQSNQAWFKVAEDLGAKAINIALEHAGLVDEGIPARLRGCFGDCSESALELRQLYAKSYDVQALFSYGCCCSTACAAGSNRQR
jgi:alkylresorcinol/alkylpyrone synthase